MYALKINFFQKNSFVEVKGGQKLADIDEFAGKIRACKEYQINPYFVVVARLEAFIAGKGLNEALKEHMHIIKQEQMQY